jgi:hypothetical protein
MEFSPLKFWFYQKNVMLLYVSQQLTFKFSFYDLFIKLLTVIIGDILWIGEDEMVY